MTPCPLCGHDNPVENKFCSECGTELAAVCPTCGTSNPPTAKFCGECGTDLREVTPAAVAPDRAEQRLVSVLFADLVGFTPFSESRDSEEVRAMLTTYFDRSRQIVERFGGTVDKFIGDAVMAVWGAVDSQEDDAERAVRAALELVDMIAALGGDIGVPELCLRAGVMTGETSVGPGGNEKGLVVGDLVNTASRLQSLADPNAVLVGEPTSMLAGGGIQFEPIGDQRVKGKDVPVAAFRALRVVGERGGARTGAGLEPPFTGRDVELRLLKDQLHAAGTERSARLVSVIGEAGIGKSRLSWELEKYVDGLASDVYWHRGRSPSYGEGLTMWALGEMVRSRAGISETDESAKSRLKLRTAVAEYVTSEDDRRWLEPRLAALLGLEDAPSGDREELFAAMRTFFHYIADRGITALIFEDMHWADPGLLEFVSDLVERSPRHPILVVALARPELLDTNPGWGSGKQNFVSLHLAPLSEDAMASLVSGMVPGIAEDAVDAIVARAAGVPLYAVEFVRMLAATGELTRSNGSYQLEGDVSSLALPESLQAVIGARIDRLEASDRELIQDASVLGQSFTLEGLSIVREELLESLTESLGGLVDQHVFDIDDDPRSPERGQYQFVQSVIREVAYGRLTKADRYARHLKVAEYFEDLGEAELMGAVASHYLAAHDAAPQGEGEELLVRGCTALCDAAARAAALQSHSAALSLYTQALELAGSDADRAVILEASADSAMWAGAADRAIGLASEAASIYESLGEAEGRLRALTKQGFVLASVFRADEAVALLRPAYDALDEPTTPAEVALAVETARAHMLNSESAKTVEVLDEVLGRAEEVLAPPQIIDGIISRATALSNLKRTHEAVALLTGAVALADRHDLQAQALRAVNNLHHAQSFEAPGPARESAEELLRRARRLGAAAWTVRAAGDAAWARMAEGELEAAEELLEERVDMGLSEFEEVGNRYVAGLIGLLRSGESERLAEVRDAVEGWAGSSDPQMISFYAAARAEVELLAGNHAAAFDLVKSTVNSSGLVLLMISAIAQGDQDRIDEAVVHVEKVAVEGRFTSAARSLGAATKAVRDGDLAMSGALAEAAEEIGTVIEPIHRAWFQALLGLMLGPDHSDAVGPGREARVWVRERRLRHLENLWAEWLPSDDVASESA